jgi:hypothetical protein
MGFLWFWGPSIEPEKASLKSASTANPPQNDHFIPFLLKIYHYSWLRQFIATHYRSVGYFILVLGMLLLLFPLLVFSRSGYSEFFW